ncbi:diacylglycerol/lipid kinase family protein [Pseudarcicella hirudinis]|uniref:diacylglycerol/lipid kinase family protein n=1 Tax=Pseudarcicella hirudinis TaxID=1079859 RepID=UPI001E3F570C|nr:diacylglycerol kinase family protein [Pseudarcicella hirudinis]
MHTEFLRTLNYYGAYNAIMLKDGMLKLLFVVNPISGGNENVNWKEGIQTFYKDSQHNLKIILLNGIDDEISLKETITSFEPDKVIAVGGDGTIKLVAEQLIHSKIVLGILPAGSANGLATELGIPAKPEEALRIIEQGVIRKIDVIEINNQEICIHLSDLGLNALLIKYFEEDQQRGMWGYARMVLKVLMTKQIIKCKIRSQEKTIIRSAFMIVFANARTYGTGAVINPDGDLSDGKFEVVIVRKLSFWELLKMLIPHKAFDPKKIEILQTKEINISTKRKTHFQVDGEFRGKVNEVNARILPKVLNIILPPKS